MLWQRDQRAVRAQDAGLFARDEGDGVAEPLHVVERDVGDDGEQRLDDVGGVETAAHAHFEDGEIDLRLGEGFEGDRGQHFEVARVCGEASIGDQAAGTVVDAEVEPGKVLVADGRTVDANALVDALEMRRGVEADAVASALQDRGQSGSGRTLAVGAGNQYGAKSLFRMAERFDQRAHLLKTELAPRLAGRRVQLTHPSMETVERRSVRHSSIVASIPGRFYGAGSGRRGWIRA